MEAEIVTGSLGALRAEAILALPMHDGLIVPRSTAGLTARPILELGERIGHARLGLTVDPAPETGERQVYRAESPHIMEVG